MTKYDIQNMAMSARVTFNLLNEHNLKREEELAKCKVRYNEHIERIELDKEIAKLTGKMPLRFINLAYEEAHIEALEELHNAEQDLWDALNTYLRLIEDTKRKDRDF